MATVAKPAGPCPQRGIAGHYGGAGLPTSCNNQRVTVQTLVESNRAHERKSAELTLLDPRARLSPNLFDK